MQTIDILLKVTLVLGAAFLLARALARGSAAARHQIWAVALAASLLMPGLAAVSPQWTIAVLPVAATPSAPAASVEAVATPRRDESSDSP